MQDSVELVARYAAVLRATFFAAGDADRPIAAFLDLAGQPKFWRQAGGISMTAQTGPPRRRREVQRRPPYPPSTMSSGRLFLDRVARQHCPSPLHRHAQINMHGLPVQPKQDISTLQRIGHFYFALTPVSVTSQVVRFYYYVICPLCETKRRGR